jgi:prevent-host-death family protein
MERVGIREFRRRASELVRRAHDGEVFEITNNGRPVARLIPPATSTIAQLIAEGRVTPARGSLDDLPPPVGPTPGRPLPSEILEEMRADKI